MRTGGARSPRARVWRHARTSDAPSASEGEAEDGVGDAEGAVLGRAGRRSGAGPRRARSRRPRRRSRRRPGRTRRSAPCRSRRGARRRAGARPAPARRAGRPGSSCRRPSGRPRPAWPRSPRRGRATSLATAIDALAASATTRCGAAAPVAARCADISAEPLRAAAASATSAAIRRLRSSASGCHWTPSAKRRSGASKASGSSSIDDQPVTSKPSPTRSTPWWWWDFVPWTTSPAVRAASEPSVQADVVVGAVEGARDAPVLVVAVALGQVLQQRAAGGDVHDLHPAADAQQRQVALERAAGERDLEVVALGHRAAGLRVGLLPVGRGVDVGAAGEDQPVEQVEDRVGLVLERLVGRQHERDPAGALDGVDVGARQQVGLLVPHAPARALERGADADDGTGHGVQATQRRTSRQRGDRLRRASRPGDLARAPRRGSTPRSVRMRAATPSPSRSEPEHEVLGAQVALAEADRLAQGQLERLLGARA